MKVRHGTSPAQRRLKILEITNVDFSLRQFLWPLMRGLRAAGCDVIGACAEGPQLEVVRADGFTVRAVPFARNLSPVAQMRAFWAVYRLIRREKPDIVHAHMPISGILARMAAWLCRVPLVAYTCHGFLFNQPGSRKRRGLALILEWIGGQATDLYLTVSQEEARDARRLHINRRAQAIGNGRDLERFKPDAQARQSIRRELGVSQGRTVMIAVSRLVRHKGYPELLRAMELVPEAELWIVGERLPSDHGEDMARFLAEAGQRLGERLRLLGYRDDIPALLAAADIFVLPSHFEGLPMSIIEAMLCGLPVVATNIKGPREQVLDRQTGILVPPGLAAPLAQALQRLAHDPALRAEMGQAGLARARMLYNEKEIVARTVNLLLQSARNAKR